MGNCLSRNVDIIDDHSTHRVHVELDPDIAATMAKFQERFRCSPDVFVRKAAVFTALTERRGFIYCLNPLSRESEVYTQSTRPDLYVFEIIENEYMSIRDVEHMIRALLDAHDRTGGQLLHVMRAAIALDKQLTVIRACIQTAQISHVNMDTLHEM